MPSFCHQRPKKLIQFGPIASSALLVDCFFVVLSSLPEVLAGVVFGNVAMVRFICRSEAVSLSGLSNISALLLTGGELGLQKSIFIDMLFL